MMAKRVAGWSRKRKGIVAAFTALCLTGLVGVTAISVDGGMLYLELRTARKTADAAAMAAACDLFQHYPTNNGTDPSGTAKQSALDVAAANGFTNDTTNSTVVVNIPPLSGAYKGLNGYAEVIVTYQVQRAFSRIWGTDTIPVKARAVSRGAWVKPNVGVLVLDYTGKATFSTQGNGAFTEAGGPVIVNSNDPSAQVDSGNATITGQQFDITGGLTLNGGANWITSPVPGQMFLGTHPTPDPLAYLPPPSMPGPGTMKTVPLVGGGTQYTLTPGTYSNLPVFTSGDTVIMEQASYNNNGGIYYINGGGFKSTGASITMDSLTSGGLMIYNSPVSTADSQKLQITGNAGGSVELTPLTSGPYQGMMLWQDRTSSVPVLVEGNGFFSVNGTFYAPGAILNINGNGTTITGYYLDSNGILQTGGSLIGSQYISNQLALGGNGNIKINYSGPNLAKTRIITLVE
jgi:hypothetical protein